MAEYLKPLPKSDPLTARFWESVHRGGLEIQRCDDCGSFVFFPRGLCPAGSSRSLTWRPVSGRGQVYSFTIVHRPTSPVFRDDVPYVVALVELEEGCRMMSNIVDVAATPEGVWIGMPVTITYDRVSPTMTLPKFRPSTR